MHLPRVEIAERAPQLVVAGSRVVVYCWGQACNGGTKATIDDKGHQHRLTDPPTSVVGAGAIACDC